MGSDISQSVRSMRNENWFGIDTNFKKLRLINRIPICVINIVIIIRDELAVISQ